MSRQRTSTRRMGTPSQRARTRLSLATPHAITASPGVAATAGGAAVESGLGCARAGGAPAAPVNARSARANRFVLALTGAAGRAPCSALRPDPIAGELRLAALRETLHQLLERPPGLRRVAQPLLAESLLVERRRGAVARAPTHADTHVLHQRAV